MFRFGVAYYPEQWPEERWSEDARLMVEAGFTVVRLAEFAWGRIERREGVLDFDWLDRAIELFASRGMRVILGTPTASPPPWLMRRNPEFFRVREDGVRAGYGNRREYCPTNPGYRTHCARIVTAMADRYGAHPAVAGWQVDNEIGERCYCPACSAAFHAWLEARYGSVDEMNRRWGTAFWGHLYGAWDEVAPPGAPGGPPNPGLALDWFRFATDAWTAFVAQQAGIIRARAPGPPVTHNLMGFRADHIDYARFAADLDFVSWDNYPRNQWDMRVEVDPSAAALSHDTMRCLRPRGFWVMEQQAGPAGWELVGVTPRPGELRLWALQSVARGADGLLFFRWRTSRFGTEQYWHGLLDHDGSVTPRYREAARLGRELGASGELVHGSRIVAEAALVFSPESRFALQLQPCNPGISYNGLFAGLHSSLHRRNIPVDVVGAGTDLAQYRLVVAPLLHVARQADAGRLEAAASAGATVVLTFRSGVKDDADAVVDARLPGVFARMCGLEVEGYESLAPGERRIIEPLPSLGGVPHLEASAWSEGLLLRDAVPLARWADGAHAGRAAISMRAVGAGAVVYVGGNLEAAGLDALVGWLCDRAGLRAPVEAPAGVEVTERRAGDRRILFLLNHGSRTAEVELAPGAWVDAVSGERVGARLCIGPRDGRILATP